MATATTTNSFLTGLSLIKELIFGILAVGGCLITQCLIIAWLAVSKAQINFVLLQARMLRRIYGQQPIENKVECRSAGTQTEGEVGLDLGLFHFTDKVSKAPIVSLPPAPETKSADLPVDESKQAKTTGSDWQTQSLVERKPNGKRPYAIKQVDNPALKKPIVPAVRLSSKAAEFRSLLDVRGPSPVPQGPEATSAKAKHTINPAAQEQPAHSDDFSSMDSSSGRSSASWKAKYEYRNLDNIWAPIEDAQPEHQRSKFKFSKSSGVKLIKHDGPTGQDTNHDRNDADVTENVPDADQAPSKTPPQQTTAHALPFNNPSTPVKRFERDEMCKLRESPMVKAPEHLSATKHLIVVAKNLRAVEDSLVEKSEAWDGPNGWSSIEAWHSSETFGVPDAPRKTKTRTKLIAQRNSHSFDSSKGSGSNEAAQSSGESLGPSNTPSRTSTPQFTKERPSWGSRENREALHDRQVSKNGSSRATMQGTNFDWDGHEGRLQNGTSWPKTPEPHNWCSEPEDQDRVLQSTSQQVAREAVAKAFSEREEYRIKLNNGYSLSNASEFKEKAKAYNKKRRELIAHMPLEELDEEDVANFPCLSTLDTGPPPVNSLEDEESSQPTPQISNDTQSVNSPAAICQDLRPLIAGAQKSYQTMLQASTNLKAACGICRSRFCLKGFSAKARPKMKAARELYERRRQSLLEAHEDGVLPEELARKLPVKDWC